MKAKKGTKKPIPKPAPKTQTKIKRIPRQEGITSMMTKYHNTKDNRIKKIVQQTILSRYITQGMTLDGETRDMEYIARYLGIGTGEIMKSVVSTTETMLGITDGAQGQGKQGLEAMGRALISQAFFMALNDRGLIHTQALNMLASQGAEYQPFMSTTVNQALKNLLDSQKPIQDLLKVMTGGPVTNIFVPNQGSPNGPNQVPNKQVSIQDAIQLINESNEGLSLLERPEAQLQLADRYHTEEFPEVIATKQSGTQKEVDIYQPKKVRRHEDRVEGLGEIEA